MPLLLLFCICCSYVKACLGGPTPAEYDALVAERESLKKELEDARQQIAELQAKVSSEHATSMFLQAHIRGVGQHAKRTIWHSMP
jgi:hypothetical protein